MSIRVLSFHADYCCGHSGACCTAGWPIPLEPETVAPLQSAIDASHLIPVSSLVTPIVGARGDAPATLGIAPRGACVFHRGGTAGCAIHHALGHSALPLACRQFPRVSVLDPRGTSVTLSHYCPTAAALLDDESDIAIVEQPAGFPADGEYVGLDVRPALPPLLRPDVLMDWDAWWEWERMSVGLIASSGSDVRHAVTMLGDIVEDVRGWSPGSAPLINVVRAAFGRPRHGPAIPSSVDRTLGQVLGAIPLEWRPRAIARDVRTSPGATRHFVAAHAFANWTAHQGRGLRTWWRSIDAAVTLVEAGLGVRQTDLLLRHLADPQALAREWSAYEERAG